MRLLLMPLLPPVPCVGDEQNSFMIRGQQEVARVVVEDLMATAQRWPKCLLLVTEEVEL